MNFFKLVPRDVGEATQDHDAQLFETKEERLRDIVSMKSSETGEIIWLNADNALFYDPAAGAQSIYTISLNVSEVVETRDQAEDALAQLMLLQQIAEVGFWSWDLQAGTVYRSDEVCRIHGKDPETFKPSLSKGVEFFRPEDRQTLRSVIERVRSQGGQFHFQLRIINDEGERVPVKAFGLARMDARGKVGRIIGVFRATR